MGQSVEMCAIYKYGNDDVLRVNAFFSLFVQFDAFCFRPILPPTIWLCMGLVFFYPLGSTCYHVFSSSTFFIVVFFMLRIFISDIYRYYGIAS